MKTIMLIILIFFAFFSSRAQINMSIYRGAYDRTKKIQLTNSDKIFTYKVNVFYKQQIVKTILLSANQSQVVDFNVKNKKIAKKMYISWTYDSETRNIDRNIQLSKSKEYENYANNIETECWKEARQKGWQLALVGLLCGDGKLIEALKEIVTSQYMSEEGIKYQIQSIKGRLEYKYLKSCEQTWLESALDYYKDLLSALETPFTMCPDLKYKQQQYWQTAKALKDGVIEFDKKFDQEKNHSNSKELYKYASNLQILTPSFTGFGVEINYHTLSSLPALEDGKANPNLDIVDDKKSNFTPEIKLQIPITKPFNGLVYHLPARLLVTTSFGQGIFSYKSDGTDIYLGVKDRAKPDGIVDYAIGSLGTLNIKYEI